MNNTNEYICFIDKFSRAFEKVDKDICNLLHKWNPITLNIPSVITKDVLNKIGYFNSFPHQIISINGLLESKKFKNLYLTPSACLHFYPIFGELKIHNGIYTTRARVFRNEENNTDGMTRLIDFTVREIVVVGTEKVVRQKLEQISNSILQYANSIGISINLEPASDPFYPTRKNMIKKQLQLSNNQKREMIIKLNEKNLSIGSVNYHGFHFSKPFDFDDNNNIVTGCIGIGLERWITTLNENNLIDKLFIYDCEK